MRNLTGMMKAAIIITSAILWYVVAFIIGQFGSTLVAAIMVISPIVLVFVGLIGFALYLLWSMAIRDQRARRDLRKR